MKPNIIFIMADDLGYGDLGCYGATHIPTPHIDQVAAEGMLFTDAHAPSAVCTPTRYGVLTGRYSWRSRLKAWTLFGYDPLLIDTDRLTVASMLKEKGYSTAAVGKWHLGLGNDSKTDFSKPLKPGPLDLGFDYFFGIAASLDMPPYCFIENDRVLGALSEEKHPYNTLQRKGPMTPGWKDEEVGPTFTEKAVRFIERQAGDEAPFFLYLPYHAPHTPCTPPDFIAGRSDAGVRGDMVTEFDWMVGQIDRTLEKHGMKENTLFIITSDNGALTTGPSVWADGPPEAYDLAHNGHEPNGELRGQKADIFEGGHRIPYIVRWPGKVPAGSRNNHIVCLTDLMATAAAITGVKLPDNAAEDSYNILDEYLNSNQQAVRKDVILHSGNGSFSIREGDWKLEICPGSGGFSQPEPAQARAAGLPLYQLYNLREDPAETQNLQDTHTGKVDELLNLLQEYVEKGRSTPGKAQTNDREVDIFEVLPDPEGRWQPVEVDHLGVGAAVRLLTKAEIRFSRNGLSALTDGWRGTLSYADGYWAAVEGSDFALEVDLGKPIRISEVRMGFLGDHNPWIFLPRSVRFSFSEDQERFSRPVSRSFTAPQEGAELAIHDCHITPESAKKARYIRIEIDAQKTCPEWHPGAGGKAWCFVDEIMVL